MRGHLPTSTRVGAIIIGIICNLALWVSVPLADNFTFSTVSAIYGIIWLVAWMHLLIVQIRSHGDVSWNVMEEKRTTCECLFAPLIYFLCAISFTAIYLGVSLGYVEYGWFPMTFPFVNAGCLLNVNYWESPMVIFSYPRQVIDAGFQFEGSGRTTFIDRTRKFDFTHALNLGCTKDILCCHSTPDTQISIKTTDAMRLGLSMAAFGLQVVEPYLTPCAVEITTSSMVSGPYYGRWLENDLIELYS